MQTTTLQQLTTTKPSTLTVYTDFTELTIVSSTCIEIQVDGLVIRLEYPDAQCLAAFIQTLLAYVS